MCKFKFQEKVRKLSEVEDDKSKRRKSSFVEYMKSKLSISKPVFTLWYIGDSTPDFVGRSEFLEKLHKAITRPISQGNLREDRITILKGLEGVGKSEVARKYAELHGKSSFDENVLWIKSETFETLTNSFAVIFRILRIPEATKSSRSQTERHEKIYRYFSSQQLHSLFIFDDAQNFKYIPNSNESGIDVFLPTNPHEHGKYHPHFLILTSRSMRDSVGIAHLQVLTLDPLTPKESSSLTQTIFKVQQDPTPQLEALQKSKDAQRLYDIVKGTPLTLKLAASFISSDDGFRKLLKSTQYPKAYLQGLATYVKYLAEKLTGSSDSEKSRDQNEILSLIWDRTLTQIETNRSLGRICIELLQILSLLDCDSITLGLLYVIHYKIPSVEIINADSIQFKQFEKAVSLLQSYGLISFPTSKSALEDLIDPDPRGSLASSLGLVSASSLMSGTGTFPSNLSDISSYEAVLKYKKISIHPALQRLIRGTFSNVVPRVLPSIVERLVEVPRQVETLLGPSIFTIHQTIMNQLQQHSSSTMKMLQRLGWKFRFSLDVQFILEDVYEMAKNIADTISEEDQFFAWLSYVYSVIKGKQSCSSERTVLNLQPLFGLKAVVTVGELIKFILKYVKVYMENRENFQLVPVAFSIFLTLMNNWKFNSISMNLTIQLTTAAVESLMIYLNKYERIDDEHSVVTFLEKITAANTLTPALRLQVLDGILKVLGAREITSSFHPTLWIVLNNVLKDDSTIRQFLFQGGLDLFFYFWKKPRGSVILFWDDMWSSFDVIAKILTTSDMQLKEKIMDDSFLAKLSKIHQSSTNSVAKLACALIFLYILRDRAWGEMESTYNYLLFENLKHVMGKEFQGSFISIFTNYYQASFREKREMPKGQVKSLQTTVSKIQTTITKAYNSRGMTFEEYTNLRKEIDSVYGNVNALITREIENT